MSHKAARLGMNYLRKVVSSELLTLNLTLRSFPCKFVVSEMFRGWLSARIYCKDTIIEIEFGVTV